MICESQVTWLNKIRKPKSNCIWPKRKKKIIINQVAVGQDKNKLTKKNECESDTWWQMATKPSTYHSNHLTKSINGVRSKVCCSRESYQNWKCNRNKSTCQENGKGKKEKREKEEKTREGKKKKKKWIGRRTNCSFLD